MDINILVTASALSDRDLLDRLEVLAGNEREASAELVAHLAALEIRPALYAAQGYGSLFGYCTQALRLSEDAACNRIAAARACRRLPPILDLLASGSLSLTSVRLLGPHLTAENHESVLARALRRTRREIEALVAELAPRPDLPSTVRRTPCRVATPSLLGGPGPAPGVAPEPGLASGPAMTGVPSVAATAIAPPPSALPATPRPIVQALAPERYRVQFTIGQETHEKLRRLQALLRREIPDGDPGAIFDRALTVLLEKVEKTKLASVAEPRPRPPIRPETDTEVRKPAVPSRHAPPALPSRTVKQGPATVANISLRCRRHNQFEAEMIFGPHRGLSQGVLRRTP